MSELAASDVNNHVWLAFSRPTSEEQARIAFRARYGRDPELIGISLGNVLAGPVPQEEGRC